MKRKVSVSLGEDTLDKIRSLMLDGTFRNKSHFIETALSKFIKERENDK